MGDNRNSKVLNERKYNKLMTALMSKFPEFNFSEVNNDYSISPTNYHKMPKQMVKCPIHGWFQVYLRRMLDTRYGCNKCGHTALRRDIPIPEAILKRTNTSPKRVVSESTRGVKLVSWGYLNG